MGLTGDIAEHGSDLVQHHERRIEELEHIAEVGRKFVDVSETVTRFFESGPGKRLVKTATSPILNAGQQVITGIRLTTGVGDPEAGDRFGEGAGLMRGAGQTLQTAFPDDSWDGNSSSSYAARTNDQLSRTETVIGADYLVAAVLARESEQITTTRQNLDAQSDWLADMSLVTMATGVIPYVGPAAKTAAEIAMVSKALGTSTDELMALQHNADANAAALQAAVQQYSAAGQHSEPDPALTPPSPEDDEDSPHEHREDEPGTDEDGLGDGTGNPPAVPTSGAVSGGVPAGQGGGSAPGVASTTPNAQPAGAPTGGSEMAGVMAGALGAVLAPLGAVLGGVTQAAAGVVQAATGAVQAATQAAGQSHEPAAFDPETDRLDNAGDGKKVDEGEPSQDTNVHENAENDAVNNADPDGPRADDRVAAGPPDDGAAKTLPPDLVVGAGNGGASVPIGVDLPRDRPVVPVADRLDRADASFPIVTRT